MIEDVTDFLKEIVPGEGNQVYTIEDLSYGFVGVTDDLRAVYSIEKCVEKYYPKETKDIADGMVWELFTQHIDQSISEGFDPPLLINTISL